LRNCGGEFRGEDGNPVVILGTHILKECPNSFITEWSRETIDLFHLCHSIIPSLGGLAIIPGPLPSSGGVFDQDNATMEAFSVIRNEMMSMAEEEEKRKKGKAKV